MEDIKSKDNKQEKISAIKERIKSKKRIYEVIILIAIIVFAIYARLNAAWYQSTDDAYIESKIVQIAPRVSGQVDEVLIQDNQYVNEGDVLVKIDEENYKLRFEQAEAQYKKMLSGQNIMKANLSATNSKIALAKKDLDRYQKLYNEGAVSKQVLDSQITKYEGVKAELQNAEEQVLSSSNNKVADLNLKEAKSFMDIQNLNLKYTKVTAPVSGKITNKKVEKGAFVQTGQPLFAIVPDEVWVIANFKESQVGKMHIGQSVDIKVDAYPNKIFKGKIDSIQSASGAKSSLFPPENAVGSFVKIVQRIPVKIVFTEEIDKSKYNIVAGMSVVPKVCVKK